MTREQLLTRQSRVVTSSYNGDDIETQALQRRWQKTTLMICRLIGTGKAPPRLRPSTCKTSAKCQLIANDSRVEGWDYQRPVECSGRARHFPDVGDGNMGIDVFQNMSHLLYV